MKLGLVIAPAQHATESLIGRFDDGEEGLKRVDVKVRFLVLFCGVGVKKRRSL